MMLTLSQLTKSYSHAGVPALGPIDLELRPKELVAVVGPSGCGKSTLLRLVAGLEAPSSGEIRIEGRRVEGLAPAERGIAIVFQEYALYPHMTVRGNISFGLEMQKLARAEIGSRVTEAAALLGLERLLERKPAQLSGGERQRVAIARAIVKRPRVFLFDEPLSNLDAQLRAQMRMEIGQIHRRVGATTLYVTHDQAEAMTLADRVVVLNRGQVQQAGAPLEVYREPANRFVASFLGSPGMNFVDEGGLVLGLRPENLRVGDEGPHEFEVRWIERHGYDVVAVGEVRGERWMVRTSDPSEIARLTEARVVRLAHARHDERWFARETGEQVAAPDHQSRAGATLAEKSAGERKTAPDSKKR